MWMNHIQLESGGDLLSRAVSSQVPSALKGLTSVFGMGTGGTPSPLPPEIVSLLWGLRTFRLVSWLCALASPSVAFAPLALAQGYYFVSSVGSLSLPGSSCGFCLGFFLPSGLLTHPAAFLTHQVSTRATISHFATFARFRTLTTARKGRRFTSLWTIRLSLD